MKLVDLLFETGFGTSMTQVPPGVGRNAHSVHTDPYTWEDYEGMSYDISTQDDDGVYASISCEDGNKKKKSYTHKFSTEEEALNWVRQEHEKLRRNKMAKQR